MAPCIARPVPLLFPGSVGKAGSREGFESLYAAVVGRVFDVLPDENWAHPGHGDDTTLGVERPHLTEWYDRKW